MEFYSVQEQEAGLGAGPHHDISWEDERPPTYNPEDYSAHLTRSGFESSFVPSNIVLVQVHGDQRQQGGRAGAHS